MATVTDGHDHVESQEAALCVVKDDCTDLEVAGRRAIDSFALE